MAMGNQSSNGAIIADINITPLTDVMLVLLIIFMVTATFFVSEPAMQVQLPSAVSSDLVPREQGEITVIVPHDIVYPHVPQVLRHFHTMYPRMQVQLLTQNTLRAKESFARGECDLILTTEMQCEAGGKTLTRLPLLWIGAPGGQAWRQRPLRLAQGRVCAFRAGVVAALDRAGIDWETAVESESDRTLEAAVSCDMAIHALLAGTEPPHAERIAHGGALPELSSYLINLYVRPGNSTPGVTALAELLEKAWDGETRSAVPLAAE